MFINKEQKNPLAFQVSDCKSKSFCSRKRYLSFLESDVYFHLLILKPVEVSKRVMTTASAVRCLLNKLYVLEPVESGHAVGQRCCAE